MRVLSQSLACKAHRHCVLAQVKFSFVAKIGFNTVLMTWKKLTMIRIEPELWMPQTYARAHSLFDVLRHPVAGYAAMSAQEKDAVRQSQLEPNEVLRVLGFHEAHALVMKSDRVLGWCQRDAIGIDAQLLGFEMPVSARLTVEDFFQLWQGTPYIWGGVTRAGIDCSGLTQRYYLDVLAQQIPKNTYEQRRAGSSKTASEMAQHDLVFCTRIGGRGIHHVGIYVGADIWHAHGERGVIRQTLGEFLTQYQVLEVVGLCVTA